MGKLNNNAVSKARIENTKKIIVRRCYLFPVLDKTSLFAEPRAL